MGRVPRLVVAFAVAQALRGLTLTNGQELSGISAASACEDFATGQSPALAWSLDAGHNRGQAWTLEDCIEVWTRWSSTIFDPFIPRNPEADLWRDTASELREKGSPCLLASAAGGDGLGSTTLRHVATWIFAGEMGCDWVTPDWGRRKVPKGDGKAVMYCHSIVSKDKLRSHTNTTEAKATQRCSIVDWLSFFQFEKTSVSWPASGSVKVIQPVKRSLVSGIIDVKRDLESTGFQDRGWKHLVFQIDPTTAAHHLVNVGSWDGSKRGVVRNVLGQMRANFHRHPRKWYPENPHCMYDAGRLHFAIHVRLGDRSEFAQKNPQYFQRLEGVMATISQQVELQGLAAPLFHVFTETFLPCPSEQTGLFKEFPAWPVAADQVAACSSSEPAIEIFRVADKPIMLHVDHDVENAMSCMIKADGVLMGCSTFGQIAGLLSTGISMFSMECAGDRTPQQYRTIPPLAISEMGYLWVPVEGSWYDPELTAVDIFRHALDAHVSAKGSP